MRQGCSLDLFLFVILFGFHPSKNNVEKNVVYADDLALITDNQSDVTKLLTEMTKPFGLAQTETSMKKNIVIKSKK